MGEAGHLDGKIRQESICMKEAMAEKEELNQQRANTWIKRGGGSFAVTISLGEGGSKASETINRDRQSKLYFLNQILTVRAICRLGRVLGIAVQVEDEHSL